MEHESDPSPNQNSNNESDVETTVNSRSWVKIIFKLILGMIVLFIVAVAFVFGVCLLG